MRTLTLIIYFALFCSACSSQGALKTYEISTAAPDITMISTHQWDGRILFPGIYCANVPTPGRAIKHTARMYSNNRIYVGAVHYPDNLMVTVAFSKFPKSITTEDYIASQFIRNSEVFAGESIVQPGQHDISLKKTMFGSTIRLTHKNIEAFPENGPFPLIINTYTTAQKKFYSMAVRQIFARDDDLLEVAAIHTNDSGFKSSEAEIEGELNSMVEDLTSSLQRCTASMRYSEKFPSTRKNSKFSFTQ